jgi:hypothetical protein
MRAYSVTGAADLAARQELSDLVNLYFFAIDDRDLAGVVELFAPSGAFRHADGAVNVVGRDSISDFFQNQWARNIKSIHSLNGQIATLDGLDLAHGTVSAAAELVTPQGAVRAALRYEDSYIRFDGRWRFQDRLVRFWYRALADVSARAFESGTKSWPSPGSEADLPGTRAGVL